MDAVDQKVFEAVARLGGMGRAADALHTVQSNVTAKNSARRCFAATPERSSPRLPGIGYCLMHFGRRDCWTMHDARRWMTARLKDRLSLGHWKPWPRCTSRRS